MVDRRVLRADIPLGLNGLNRRCCDLPSVVLQGSLGAFVTAGAIEPSVGQHRLNLDDGAEPLMLLGLLSYNFHRLFLAKEMMDEGVDRKEVAGVVTLIARKGKVVHLNAVGDAANPP